MKLIGLLIACAVSWFCILALSCQLSQKLPTGKTGLAPGVIWNRANASVSIGYDEQVTRGDDVYQAFQTEAPPAVLAEPCYDWVNMDPSTRSRLLTHTANLGVNPCAFCHCNTDYESAQWMVTHIVYGWPPWEDVCTDLNGNLVYYNSSLGRTFHYSYRADWLQRPDDTFMRWRR